MAHRIEIAVRFYELDPYDHVNHSAYIQYFEVARIALLRDIGYTLGGMREQGRMIVVSEIATKFLLPATEGDRLTVETEVLEIQRVASRWRQRILRSEDVLVTQDLRAAFVDLSGKPVRFPTEIVEALAPYRAAP